METTILGKKINTFYLSIGGLIIEIIVSQHKNLHYSEHFIKECLIPLKAFFVKKAHVAKVNHKIVVEDMIEIYQSRQARKKNYLSRLSINISDDTTKIFTHLSYIQFLWILEQLLYQLIIKNNGFFLHCSGILYKGKAYLFTAEDGGGKSTIMIFLKDLGTPIADDTAIIRKVNNKYSFFSSPLRAKNFKILSNVNNIPINSIYFLKKATFYDIKKIKNKTEILSSFHRHLFCADKKLFTKSTKNFYSFFKSFNDVYSFYFKKNKSATKEYFLNFLEGT